MIFSKIIPFEINHVFTPFKRSRSSLGIYSVQLNTYLSSAYLMIGTVAEKLETQRRIRSGFYFQRAQTPVRKGKKKLYNVIATVLGKVGEKLKVELDH